MMTSRSHPRLQRSKWRTTDAPIADSDYIRARLDDPGVGLLDVRSAEEFSGVKRFADRGGHIPGAVNLEWTLAMDQTRNLRFKPDEELEHLYAQTRHHPRPGDHHLLPESSPLGAHLHRAAAPGLPAGEGLSGLVVGLGQQPRPAGRVLIWHGWLEDPGRLSLRLTRLTSESQTER